MAATYAECVGQDRVRTKVDHRLGSESATGIAKTWHTRAEAHVNKDGSGYVSVVRDGVSLHVFTFDSED